MFPSWNKGFTRLAEILLQNDETNIEFKSTWAYCHPVEYTGIVSIQIIPKPENLNKEHEYRVRWGAWEYTDKIHFNESMKSIRLIHMKGNDVLSIPIFFYISHPSYIVFGKGQPTDESIQEKEINYGWTRIISNEISISEIRNDLIILSAQYGLDERSIDVTAQIKNQMDQDKIQILVNNLIAGDPLIGTKKELKITYIYKGQENTLKVPEGEVLKIP